MIHHHEEHIHHHEHGADAEAQRRKMLETPIPKLIMSLGLPTVASQLVSTIYNTADTYFVSQIGTSAAAAVGVVFALMSIFQAMGYGVGMGANSLISRRLGAGKVEEANRYASSAFAASFGAGCLIMVLGLIFLEPLMRLLGSTETMLPHSVAYARIILIGAPLITCSFTMNNLLRAEGKAMMAMIGLCTGGILNMGLDPLFIFTLNMGTAGAALATVLSQAISFGILLSFYLRGRTVIELRPGNVSRSVSDYTLIVTTGAPTFCRQGLASLASALLNRRAAAFGDAAVAAITISNKIYLLVRNIILGIGQGATPVMGYNYGAGNKKRAREAFGFATKLGTAVCVAAAALLAWRAGDVITWFRDDPEVIRIGTTALYFACGVMPFMAFSTYVNQLYQSLGLRVCATFLACCRQGVCFIPLAYLLPWLFGLTGVQMLQPGADLLTFCISVPFLIRLFRKELRLDGEPAERIAKNAGGQA